MNDADLVASWHLLKLAEEGRPIETVSQFLASMWLSGGAQLPEIMSDLGRIQERVSELMDQDGALIWIPLLPGGGQGLDKLHELDDRFERPTFAEKLRMAEETGKQHGKSAASWYFDRANPSREDYMRVFLGINDGDPEILDSFPTNPLSGEMAGSFSTSDLADEVEMDAGDEAFDEVCSAYEDAFRRAAQDDILQQCLSGLEREIEFHVRAKLDIQDEDEILQKMEEIVNISNASLEHSETQEL